MAREVRLTGIVLHANAAPCFHHCRYCQLRTSKPRAVSFSGFEKLVNRFLDWRIVSGRPEFEVWPWYGNSHEHDEEMLLGLRSIGRRLGYESDVVLLGGVAHRSMPEMRAWLQERRAAGIDTVVATFSGDREKHDYWNNKEGNWQFQLDTLHLAADMGFRLQERVLLLRDNLPSLERLFDALDTVEAAERNRWAIPLFYSGRAKRLESQRLTEGDFAALPKRIRDSLRGDHEKWRSERRWVELVREEGEPGPEEISPMLRVTEENLAWAEPLSCDEIIAALEERWRAAYAAMPSRRELCDGYSDPQGDKVYMFLGQMEHLWLDRYLAKNPAGFDIRSTHFF